MHSQDVLEFIKKNKEATINEIMDQFPNVAVEHITEAIYMYLRELRAK